MARSGLVVASDFDGTVTNSLGDPKTNKQGRRYKVFLHAYQEMAAFCSAHNLRFEVPIPPIAEFCRIYRESGFEGLIKPHLSSLFSDRDRFVILSLFKSFFDARLKLYHPDDLACDFVPDENLKALPELCAATSLSLISYRNQGRDGLIVQCRQLSVVGAGVLAEPDVNTVGSEGASSAEAKAIFLRKWYKDLLREQKRRGWKPIAIGDSHSDLIAAALMGFPVFIGVTETGEDGEARFNKAISGLRESDGVKTELHLFPSLGHPECVGLVKKLAAQAA